MSNSKLKIKISNIQHLTDARYFSSREVEYLGFDRLTTPSNDVKLIEEWIYGPQIVSEFIGNNCIVDIQKLLEGHNTDVVHFDCFTDPDTISNFSDYEIFMDIDIDNTEITKVSNKMQRYDGLVDYFVIKSFVDFQKITSSLSELTQQFPCFLDINFDKQNIADLLKLNAEGIILRGGSEERVGVKSFDELDEIMELLGC